MSFTPSILCSMGYDSQQQGERVVGANGCIHRLSASLPAGFYFSITRTHILADICYRYPHLWVFPAGTCDQDYIIFDLSSRVFKIILALEKRIVSYIIDLPPNINPIERTFYAKRLINQVNRLPFEVNLAQVNNTCRYLQVCGLKIETHILQHLYRQVPATCRCRFCRFSHR